MATALKRLSLLIARFISLRGVRHGWIGVARGSSLRSGRLIASDIQVGRVIKGRWYCAGGVAS